MKWGWNFAALMFLLTSCAAPASTPQPTPTVILPAGMTEAQAAALNSLTLIDDYPLYTMHYSGPYTTGAALQHAFVPRPATSTTCTATWGCSLFATLGDEGNRLYGRNFDWEFSPAILLFNHPADGYASVSMVDIYYLGFEGEVSKHILDLSLEQRRPLLDAPWLPFDGMNEKGLAIGMAAVDREEMPNDPQKRTVGHLEIIREMLDHAATVDEAITILGDYNIDMGNVPLHYLIASASGESALVEFKDAQMHVFRNETTWQAATNFLLSYMNGHPEGECPRYDRITRTLTAADGRMSSAEAMQLLRDVSQENTQWSIVYGMTGLDLSVIMERGFSSKAYTFHLE